MAVIANMLVNEEINMDDNNIAEVLRNIQYKIDVVRYTYNIEPNKIIIGAEASFWIRSYFLDYLWYVDDRENREERYELYGIPVVIDYNNPWNVDVCICFKVYKNNESICDR